MFSKTPFLLLSFLSSVAALIPSAPEATPGLSDAAIPSSPPAPTPAPFIPYGHVELFKRQQLVTVNYAPDNTCGYFGGRAGAPLSCAAKSYSCVFVATSGGTGPHGNVGCCPPLGQGDCGFRFACVDYKAFYNSSICSGDCEHDSHTVKCTETSAPFCNSITYTAEGISDYFCDNVAITTWQTMKTTFNGQVGGATWSTSTIDLDATSSSKVVSSGDIPFGGSKPTSTPVPTSSSSITPNPGPATTSLIPSPLPVPTPGDSKPPVAAIAGGVVGGVAGIALIVLGVFFILRHERHKREAAVAAATAAAAGTPGSPPPPGYTGPDGAAMAGKQTTEFYNPNGGSSQPGFQQAYGAPGFVSPETAQTGFAPQASPGLSSTGTYYDPNAQGQGAYYNPNAQQGHLSAEYPDRGDTTSPGSTLRMSRVSPGSELAGSEGWGQGGMVGGAVVGGQQGQPGGGYSSPMQGYSEMAARGPVGQFPGTDGRMEMMGSGVQRPQGPM